MITANITNSTINNCSVGIYVGYYDKPEYSNTVVSGTNFINCETDLLYEGEAGTSTFTTYSNSYSNGTPTIVENYGNVIIQN